MLMSTLALLVYRDRCKNLDIFHEALDFTPLPAYILSSKNTKDEGFLCNMGRHSFQPLILRGSSPHRAPTVCGPT